jgi:hypothetical protein
MQDLKMQMRSVQYLFILVDFVRNGFRGGSKLNCATAPGSSLSRNLFLYGADPLGRQAALAEGVSSTLPSSARLGGSFRAIMDRTLAIAILPISTSCA